MIAGILLQWNFQWPEKFRWIFFLIGLTTAIGFFLLPFFKRFQFDFLSGIATSILFLAFGGSMTFQNDIRNDKDWLGNSYKVNNGLLVTLDEPPIEKTKSSKANATLQYLFQDGNAIRVKGKIILYFQKDSLQQLLNRINSVDTLSNLHGEDNYFVYNNKRILLLDKAITFAPQQSRTVVDILVISKNPKFYMKKLAASLDIKQVVFDGSVPSWKSVYWKKDCDSLHIPWYDVTMNGAFEIKIN